MWLCAECGDAGETVTRRGQSSAGSYATGGASSSRAGDRSRMVLVHVYDLGDSFLARSLNSVAKDYGAFHTGVEVYGREWYFGAVMEDSAASSPFPDVTGVAWHVPKLNSDHGFRESLSMGFTTLSEIEVQDVLEQMRWEWRSSTYNVLSRNCHDFSNELCRRLGVCSLPPWVNALAPKGQSTYEYFENTDSGYDGGEAVFELLGAVRKGFWRGLGWDEEVDARPPRRFPSSVR